MSGLNLFITVLVAIAAVSSVAMSAFNVKVALGNSRNAEENVVNAKVNERVAELNRLMAKCNDSYHDGYVAALHDLKDFLVAPGDLGDADDQTPPKPAA